MKKISDINELSPDELIELMFKCLTFEHDFKSEVNEYLKKWGVKDGKA